MQFTKAIEGYLLTALSEGYSPLTLAAYRSALLTLAEYLGDIQVEEITTEHLRNFFHYLSTDYTPERPNKEDKRPLSTASHHRYWKAVRSFFRYASTELGTHRPDQAIWMPEVTYRAIIPFTEEEVRKLIKGCEYASVPEGKRAAYQFRKHELYRNKAIILTLLDTGVRVGELTRLRVKDVNLETGLVIVQPFRVRKTRPRSTMLGKAGKKAVWRYLVNRGEVRPDDLLFVTKDDRPMTSPTFRTSESSV